MTFRVNKKYFSLPLAIKQAFKSLSFLASQRKVELKLTIPDDQIKFFDCLLGDQNRFEQILLNFITNSIKFTGTNGRIEVRLSSLNVSRANSHALSRLSDSSRSVNRSRNHSMVNSPSNSENSSQGGNIFYNRFTLEIIDNGQGISEEGKKRLFMDFSSLHEHQDINLRGTGLGLSINKRIIQAMGGSVQVESTVGVGTTFIIEMALRCKVDNVLDRSVSLVSNSSISANSQLGGGDFSTHLAIANAASKKQ
mmetsp:Transcript_28361/g.42954  ORF Transcript_28361/g.42954 Transcript_28361/m.42954 type:complete len:252 (+) Transcript_28361:892-1647(+)